MKKAIALAAALVLVAIMVRIPRAQTPDGVHSIAVGPDGAFYLLYGADIDRRIYKRTQNMNSDQGVSAQLSKIRVAPDGTVYANDFLGQRVLKIVNGQAETILQKGDSRISADPALSGRFQPDGLAIDSSGTLYIGDSGNGWLLSIDPSGDVTRLAGVDPQYQGAGAGMRITQESKGLFDGPGLSARLNKPSYLAVSKDGSVFIGEATDGLVRMYRQGNLTTIAGTLNPDGKRQAGFRDGPGTSALFNWEIGGLTVDNEGNIFVMDTQNHCVRQVTWNTADKMYYVYTLAGSPKNPGQNKDGSGFGADFGRYIDMAVDAQKNVYLVNSMDYKVRIVSWMGAVSTVNMS